MAERVVKVRLTAEVASYLDNLDKVAKKTREGRTEAQQLAASLEAQKKAFQVTGAGLLTAGGVAAAGLVLATNKAAEFDQAMSNVKAATHETAENMTILRDAAIEAGASTVFSAKESAEAIEELAKAGLETKDIVGGGLKGALDLAAAGGMNVADAAGVASTTLQQFNLTGDKASHVADVLAAGAGKAMGDVSDLSMALAQSGTVASQFGISVEETAGSLSAFASNGLMGSDAGTSFRSMLLHLASPSKQAAERMAELGISAYDASGQFVGMEGLAGQLEKGLNGLTQEQQNAALSIIFGSDAIRAANILYKEGADGIADWTRKVDDTGYAAETAALRLDNLKGDLEKLGGAFDSALISIGEGGQGPLRLVVQGITDLVDGFNGLPEGGKEAVFWVGAVGTAVTLASGAFFLAVPKVAAYKIAVGDLGPAAQRTAGAIGTLTKTVGAVALVATAVSAFDGLESSLRERLLPTSEALANSLKTASSAKQLFDKTLVVEDHFQLKPIIKDVEELKSVLRTANSEGDNLFTWLNANTAFTAEGAKFNEFREQWQKLATQLAESPDQIAPTFAKIRDEFNLSSDEMSRLIELSPDLTAALTQQASDAGKAADKQALLETALGKNNTTVKTSADIYKEQADQVNGVRQAMQDLMDQVNAQNSDEQKAIQTNADWLSGIADLPDAIKQMQDAFLEPQKKAFQDLHGSMDGFVGDLSGFTLTLDESTAAGADNASMLSDIAAKGQEAAQAQYDVDQKTMSAEDSTRKYLDTLAAQKKNFEDSAIAAGFNADQVKALSDRIFQMPSEKEVSMLIDTAGANDQLTQFINDSSQRQITIGVRTYRKDGDDLTFENGNSGLIGRADGGMLPGPPSSTDNMIIAAATGEFITRASQAAIPENRRVLEYINNGGRMRGYQDGGFVRPQYAAPTGGSSGGFGGGAPSVHVDMPIYPTPGMSEGQVGRIAAEKLNFALRG
ncbi:phage tail tape measure protein [Microbacterium jejuense]|uniref:phage tail tape measure protein n=1 Tax=Microbacterium jejuense TaxID=1263637 RepID=UPI0031EBD1F7